MCWERITNIHNSMKEKMFHFIWSKTLTNDLEAIVTSDACEIGSYLVVYVNIKNVKNYEYLN